MPDPGEQCSVDNCSCWVTRLKKGEPLFLLVLLAAAVLVIAQRIGEIRTQTPASGDVPRGASLGAAQAAGFDLTGCTVPTDTLLSGGPPRDGIPSLTNPKMTPGKRDTSLLPTDRVIGVEIGNKSAAYPLRILNWHECVNDVLGGTAIAVTYCPLCDSAFVFDRTVDGQVLEFGISGLLLNSNVLLYDRQPDPTGSSLWSQVAMRAVCGPAASLSKKLRPIACELVAWEDWFHRHPNSLILSFDTGHARDYDRDPYVDYFMSDQLRFPVRPLVGSVSEAEDKWRRKEPLLLVRADDRLVLYAYEDLDKAVGPDGILNDQVSDVPVSIHYDRSTKTARLVGEPTAANVSSAYSFWFAVHALQEGFHVFDPED